MDLCRIMIMPVTLTLCITAFNEESNLPRLLQDIEAVSIAFPHISVILVDNGSSDGSGHLLASFASQKRAKVQSISLKQNVGYGGGLSRAVSKSQTEFVCLFPADRQYTPEDLILVIKKFEELQRSGTGGFVVKGFRSLRGDHWWGRFVSQTYTTICNSALLLESKDINGLPKIFPKTYFNNLGSSASESFFLDAQILAVAKILGHPVEEVEVKFTGRKSGSSSWAGKRIKTYLKTLIELWRFRKFMKDMK